MSSDPSARIVVASHKPYPMPSDPLYLPLFVGAAGKTDVSGQPKESSGFARDDTGENISALNPGFCELTGLYWAWKNLTEDYIGLAHYRRHFAGDSSGKKDPGDALKAAELRPRLGRYSVFVPKKRQYVIETLYSHYAHTHYAWQLDLTREIISGKYPEYLPECDQVLKRRWGYMFNMAIMRRDLLDAYCVWLFDILFELKERCARRGAGEQLSAYQGRFYGRISEILLNVWLVHASRTGLVPEDRICELPYFNTEKTNWVRKGGAFLMAKFFRKRYEGSF